MPDHENTGQREFSITFASYLACLLFLLAVSSTACSKKPFVQNLTVTPAATGFQRQVDSIVIEKMNQYNIPGIAIGLAGRDSILYCRGYGLRMIGSDKKVTCNSIFHTASISKLFTAIAIMQLVEQKHLALEDRLTEILPEIKYNDLRVQKITIKSLLNHTSGLPDIKNYHWANNKQSATSLRDYILGLTLTVETEPSVHYRYSNLGYDILGFVIEKLTGDDFDTFVKEKVLDANGMVSSDFRYFKIPDTLKTAPHSRRRITKNVYVRKTYPYTREHAPSSTLNASAMDLCRWMATALKEINGGNTSNPYALMVKPSSAEWPEMGLGFQLYDLGSFKAVGHFGGDRGFRSFLMMIPEHQVGLVILGNGDFEEDFRQEILLSITRLMLSDSSAKRF